MTDRVTVLLLKPKDRPTFMLQWIDSVSGDRKSRSARTTKRREAEQRSGGPFAVALRAIAAETNRLQVRRG